jgi:hypothetical protein
MSTTSGGATIWYTTNGQDPRLLGGAVNAGSATAFSGSVTINGNTTVKARTLVGSTWSALTEATFVVTPEGGGVVITEINYHPYNVTPAEAAAIPGVVEDDFAFIEIHNTHPTKSINLMNMSLAGGLSFTFGSVSLGPGQHALVVENAVAFAARYGAGQNILGQWSGGLSNSGDTVELRDALGGVMMSVAYTDAAPWSRAADGDGPTLELMNPMTDTSSAANWRASYYSGGTPGSERLSLPGDYNRDRVVDAADNNAWRAGFGQIVEAEIGADGNGDGVVDAADYVVWRNNVGMTVMGSAAALQLIDIGEAAVSPGMAAGSTVTSPAADSVFALFGMTQLPRTAVAVPARSGRRIDAADIEFDQRLLIADLLDESTDSPQSSRFGDALAAEINTTESQFGGQSIGLDFDSFDPGLAQALDLLVAI